MIALCEVQHRSKLARVHPGDGLGTVKAYMAVPVQRERRGPSDSQT